MIEEEQDIRQGEKPINIRVSPSRIYTSFWNSMMFEFSQCLEETKILKMLHSIYSDFDLVNFNMERNDLLMGANFAADKLSSIEKNLVEINACMPLSFPPTIMERFEILVQNIVMRISTALKKR